MSHGSLFTGIGLLDYGLMLAGLPAPRWVCELDDWRRDEILARRFPDAVRHADVRRIGADTVEPVQLVVGGFPCKGASSAGKRNGFDHHETVLWREMARAVGELRPRHVLLENVANLLALHGGAVWGEVLGDLAALGFDVVWDCIPAAAVGAPHRRDRVFAVATHPARVNAAGPGGDDRGRGQPRGDAPVGDGEAVADADRSGPEGRGVLGRAPGGRGDASEWGAYGPAVRRWERASGLAAPKPLVRRMDDRDAAGVERSRLSALGDGVQVQVGRLMGEYLLLINPALACVPASPEPKGGDRA